MPTFRAPETSITQQYRRLSATGCGGVGRSSSAGDVPVDEERQNDCLGTRTGTNKRLMRSNSFTGSYHLSEEQQQETFHPFADPFLSSVPKQRDRRQKRRKPNEEIPAPQWFEHKVFERLNKQAVKYPLYLLLGLAPFLTSMGSFVEMWFGCPTISTTIEGMFALGSFLFTGVWFFYFDGLLGAVRGARRMQTILDRYVKEGSDALGLLNADLEAYCDKNPQMMSPRRHMRIVQYAKTALAESTAEDNADRNEDPQTMTACRQMCIGPFAETKAAGVESEEEQGNTVDKQKKVPTEELEKLDMRLKDVAACREWRERESLSVAKQAVIHSFSLLYTERTREDELSRNLGTGLMRGQRAMEYLEGCRFTLKEVEWMKEELKDKETVAAKKSSELRRLCDENVDAVESVEVNSQSRPEVLEILQEVRRYDMTEVAMIQEFIRQAENDEDTISLLVVCDVVGEHVDSAHRTERVQQLRKEFQQLISDIPDAQVGYVTDCKESKELAPDEKAQASYAIIKIPHVSTLIDGGGLWVDCFSCSPCQSRMLTVVFGTGGRCAQN